MSNYRHECPDWDFMEIDADDPEYECCLCDIDSEGRGPAFVKGDRVIVLPNKMIATVIRQKKHYDGDESFWGNLELLYEDGVKGESHCWQVARL